MPLNDRETQQRWTQVGVIRLGEQVPTGKIKDGRPVMRPSKLSTFRITSPSKKILDDIAGLYGGEVKPWQSPSGPEFEVTTKVRELPVLVPPQKIDPNYELYGAGFLDRKCDGITESKRNCPCLCKKGQNGHVHDFDPMRGYECACGAKRECKTATRLSLMIANVPGLGTYKIESHGENAAAELPMLSRPLEQADGPIPAMLIADARSTTVKLYAGTPHEKVEKRNYVVPILIFDWLTPVEAFGGQIAAAAQRELGGRDQAPIEANNRPALPSAPAETQAAPAKATTARARTPQADTADDMDPTTVEGWIEAIKAADTVTNVNRLRVRFGRAGVTDEAVLAAWKARNAELAPTSAVGAMKATPALVADTEVIDAVIVDDNVPTMTGAQAWQAALEFAHTKGWNAPALSQRFTAKYGIDHRDDTKTTDAMFVQFLGLLKSGAIS